MKHNESLWLTKLKTTCGKEINLHSVEPLDVVRDRPKNKPLWLDRVFTATVFNEKENKNNLLRFYASDLKILYSVHDYEIEKTEDVIELLELLIKSHF